VTTPEQAIEAAHFKFGAHSGSRALHAKGSLYSGTFTATPEAASLTRAAHMQGDPVEATVRLSNGGGDPGAPDYAPDVRGLAVSFHLPDGSRTDISCQTFPRFPFKEPGPFVEFIRLSKPTAASALKLPLFMARNPRAIGPLMGNLALLKPPPSYAVLTFYALHAFKWIDANGGERYVRYTWRPTLHLEPLARGEARRRGRDYLREELEARLADGPVRFELEVQVAAPGDDPDDPSSVWPDDRDRIVVGTLEITAPSAEGDEHVFDPTRVTDGIELSDDPVLRFRARAYSVSYEARTANDSQ
jgi:catalase